MRGVVFPGERQIALETFDDPTPGPGGGGDWPVCCARGAVGPVRVLGVEPSGMLVVVGVGRGEWAWTWWCGGRCSGSRPMAWLRWCVSWLPRVGDAQPPP